MKAPGAKSVVILGGGVIGLCVAYYALRRGHRVTLVDRGDPIEDSCSTGNAGMIVPSHFVPLAAPGMVGLGLRMMWNRESPFYIKPRLNKDWIAWGWRFYRSCNRERVAAAAPLLRDLNLASRSCFEEIADQTGNPFHLVKKGLLMLCKEEKTLEEEQVMAKRAVELGIPAETLSPSETARLDPGAKMQIAGSIYFPKDCHLVPRLFVEMMMRELERSGARFVWRARFDGWSRGAGGIGGIRTDQGEIQGDEYVLAAGVWSSELAKELGLNLPLQAGKGYSLTLPKPRRLPSICSILTEARVAVTPMDGALRVGGTMELAGLDASINPARVRGIVKSFSKYYPEFSPADFRDVPAWRGFRPCSPDGLPYVGRTRRYPNLSVATGHAMMGLSLGPVTGRIMAEILSDEPVSTDLRLLDPERYC